MNTNYKLDVKYLFFSIGGEFKVKILIYQKPRIIKKKLFFLDIYGTSHKDTLDNVLKKLFSIVYIFFSVKVNDQKTYCPNIYDP